MPKNTPREKQPDYSELDDIIGGAASADPTASIEYKGDIESDSFSETDALKKAFKDQAKQERKNYADANDSEYWVAICFHNREQKEEFLRLIGVEGDKYLYGPEVMERLGERLETPNGELIVKTMTPKLSALPKIREVNE